MVIFRSDFNMNNKGSVNYTQINYAKDLQINAPGQNVFIINDAKNLQIGQNNSITNNYNDEYYDDSSDDESLSNDQDDELSTCDVPIDDDKLIEISQTFSKNWKYLGKALNISEDELNDIRSTYSCKGLDQLSYQTLKMWMKDKEHPTICDLAKSLEENEDTADDYKKELYKAVLKPKRLAIEGQSSRLALEFPTSSQLVPK